jgi:hypothetical protein
MQFFIICAIVGVAVAQRGSYAGQGFMRPTPSTDSRNQNENPAQSNFVAPSNGATLDSNKLSPTDSGQQGNFGSQQGNQATQQGFPSSQGSQQGNQGGQQGFSGNQGAQQGFSGNQGSQQGNQGGQQGFPSNQGPQQGFSGNQRPQQGFSGNQEAQQGFQGNQNHYPSYPHQSAGFNPGNFIFPHPGFGGNFQQFPFGFNGRR